MALKLKQKKSEKDQLRIVSIVKELYIPYKFFLYGDIPLDFDFESKKGMILCENNSLAGFKSCKRVVKTKTFIKFDLCNDEQQLNDFQFVIDKLRTSDDKTIHELSMRLQNFQDRINAEKALDEQLRIIERLDKLLKNNEDIETDIFHKADKILDQNVAINPFIHFQIYRKTPYEFTTLRSGISVPGMSYFGINPDSFEQSMLRDNHMPINRDEKGILLALRSLQKCNIDFAKYAKSGESIDSEVIIKYKTLSFSIIESSKVYALTEYVDPQSESNYYLVLHHLGIKNKNELEQIKNLTFLAASRSSLSNSDFPLLKRRNIEEDNEKLIPEESSNYQKVFNLEETPSQINYHKMIQTEQPQLNPQLLATMVGNVSLNNNNNNNNNNGLSSSQSSFLYSPSFHQISSSFREQSMDQDCSASMISSMSSFQNQSNNQQRSNEQQNSSQNITPPPQNANKKTTYNTKAQEFISSYYDSKQDEIKKQQKFDKVLQNMLNKKQQKLKVKLV